MIENLLLMRQMMMLKVYHVAEFYSSLFDQSLLVLDFPLYEYFHFGKMLMAIGVHPPNFVLVINIILMN